MSKRLSPLVALITIPILFALETPRIVLFSTSCRMRSAISSSHWGSTA